MGRKQITLNGLYRLYRDYRYIFFPKLLQDPIIPNEDKDKIRVLLQKPWNPYVRRHSALTEKSVKLKSHTLSQHAGWSMNSNMAQKYIHYFGNESSESLLEAYGITTNTNVQQQIDRLNPKICSNCNEGNTADSKFCSKCKMIMSFEGYQEVLDNQKQKEDELNVIKDQQTQTNEMLKTLIMSLANSTNQETINTLAKSLAASGILKPSGEK
jgi:hypothetical protein